MVQIKVTTGELEEQQQDNPLKEMVCGGHRPLLSLSLLSDCSPVLLCDSEFLSLLIMWNVPGAHVGCTGSSSSTGRFGVSPSWVLRLWRRYQQIRRYSGRAGRVIEVQGQEEERRTTSLQNDLQQAVQPVNRCEISGLYSHLSDSLLFRNNLLFTPKNIIFSSCLCATTRPRGGRWAAQLHDRRRQDTVLFFFLLLFCGIAAKATCLAFCFELIYTLSCN